MKIGDTVEDFELPGTNGAFRLSAAADKIVVLYFYPKDDTPRLHDRRKRFQHSVG